MCQAKRILALLLSVVLLVQIVPTSAFAKPSTNLPEAETGASVGIGEDPIPRETELYENKPLFIVGEATDRRGETEKHFRMTDGTFIAVDYGMPVHFSTNEGETWEDIDNTLVLSDPNGRGDIAESVYTATNGNVSRSFAPDLHKGNLFSLADENHGISMSLVVPPADDNPEETTIIEEEESIEAVGSFETETDALAMFNAEAVAEITYPNQPERGEEPQSWQDQITLTKLQTEVLYRDVFPGVDFNYLLSGYNVKETILVKEALSDYSFSFSMDIGDLNPTLSEDGSISLTDIEGQIIYQIPAPYMTDAAGAFSADVSYELTETESGWQITVTADEDWINDEARAFPVAIDPTIIDMVAWTSQGIGVTYVVQGDPNQAHTQYQYVYFGYTTTNNALENQVYVGWDALPNIPFGSEVVSAQLYLAIRPNNPSNPNSNGFQAIGVSSATGELHAVSSTRPSGYSTNYDWICGLTWNTKPTLNTTVLDYKTMTASDAGTRVYWDITPLVKSWYMPNSTQSKAVGIKLSNIENYDSSHIVGITFFGYGQTAGPLFVVSYRDMSGVEPYYTYQSMGAGRAGSAYISDYTGALTTVTPLVSFASGVNPFSLNLVYNSSHFNNGTPDNRTVPYNLGYGMEVGSGFNLDVLQKVEHEALQNDLSASGTTDYLKYTDGDGTTHYFAKKQPGDPGYTENDPYFYDEDGLGLKIEEYATGYFCMKDDKGNEVYFIHGFLTYFKDANGNRINLYYRHSDGTMDSTGYPSANGRDRLDHIEQVNKNMSAITVATFTYYDGDSNAPSGMTHALKMVTDFAGNGYLFEYSNCKLLRIKRSPTPAYSSTFVSWVEFTHSYNSSTNRYVNPMTDLKDSVDGYRLHFVYETGDSKVAKYYEVSSGNTRGATATITRELGVKTIYTDWGNDRTENSGDEILTTYMFDNWGRTVNAFTTDGSGNIIGASNAVYSGAGTTDRKNNRTQRTAGIGIAAMSMVRNSGFELTDSNVAWTPVIPDSSGASAALSANGEIRTGGYSMRVYTNTNTSGVTGCSHVTEQLTAGKTYIASVYVNTENATGFGTKGVYLKIKNNSGAYKRSEYLNYKTDSTIDNGWTRLSFTYTPSVTGNHTVYICNEGVTGNVYFDDFQLEESFMDSVAAPSNVNLVENGGLRTTYYGWKNESDNTPSLSYNGAIQGSLSMVISGNPTQDKYITQTVKVKQSGTQTYVLSGWAKADAVPDNVTTATGDTEEEKAAKDTNKQFGLRAILTYSDGTKEYHYVPFNADLTDWQFASLAIVPREPAKFLLTIQIQCAYEKNANTAYFDNISLIKEVAQTMHYDADGHLASVSSTDQAEQSAEYQNGNLIQANTGTATLSYTYDSNHNLISASDGSVDEFYMHDALGNVTESKLGEHTNSGNPTTYIKSSRTYTSTGNLVKTVTDARGKVTTNTYGTYGSQMMGLPTKVHSPNGTEVTTSYKSDGRVDTSAISGTVSLSRTYDTALRLTELDREGYYGTGGTAIHQIYKFAYDAFDNTTSIKVGTKTLASYTYGARNGALTRMTYGNGDYVDYTYDILGRKTETETSDGDSYEYRYTGDGQLYEITDTDGGLLYRYIYDSIGRLIGSSMNTDEAVILQTWNKYDDNNRVTNQYWVLGENNYREKFTYRGSDGRLASKTVYFPTGGNGNTHSSVMTPTYDALMRITRIDAGATQTRFGYLAGANGSKTSMVSLYSVRKATNTSDFLYYAGYEYDNVGNITKITEKNPDGSTNSYVQYEYDNQSQLTKAISSVDGTWTYTYDTFGNLRSTAHGSETHTYSYGNSAWPDLLTAYDGENIAYEGHTYNPATGTVSGACTSGNPISYYNGTRWTFDWKNGRELTSATDGTHTITYDYDVNGLRTYKIVDGVRHDYVYASGLLLQETYTQGGVNYTLDFLYDQSGRPYMLNYTSNGSFTPYYYVLNLQGDVVAIVNSNGTAVAKYSYDAWGKVTPDTSLWMSNRNPLRYRGYYYDTETGFYYLQSRYYDPIVKRFLNADSYASTGQGFLGYNMFAYCENRPTVGCDPTGEFILAAILIGVGVGLATQYAADVVTNIADGESGWDIFTPKSSIADYLSAGISGALAASGIGLPGSIVANAALGGTTYLANCAIEGKDANLLDFGIATGIGALSGGIGGNGANSTKLVGVTKTAKQALKTAVSPKKIAMYTAKKVACRNVVIKSTIRTVLAGAASNGLNNLRKVITHSEV